MSLHAAPRRIAQRLLIIVAGLGLAGAAAAAEPTEMQRAAFKQAYAAAQQGGDSWRSLAGSLQDYPLYPYLEAASLTHDIRQIQRPQVDDYIKRYPGQLTTSDLRRDFLTELARRQDWDGFLAMYQPGLGDALSCNALQAQLSKGTQLNFDRDLAALWSKPKLPSACDPVLSAAHDQGLLTTPRLWDRIDRAADAVQPGTINSLAAWLPAADAESARRIASALSDAGAATVAANQWPDSPRNRQAAMLALERLARRQSVTADIAWQKLQSHFAFTPDQRNRVMYALALFHATDYDASALSRLIALPASVQTDTSREWRVRAALAQQDWTAVLAAIDAMPATQQQDGEWRWFRARALTQMGRDAEAQQVLGGLAAEPTFFGFLAADRVNAPYGICQLDLKSNPQRERTLLANQGLVRAFELYAVGLPKQARREWTQALDGADPDTLKLAVDLANRRGWYDRAVFTFNTGDALRYYEQRFPLASQDGLVPQAKEAGIDPSWAYAILRAESAWMADARSGADARGLMQLLPSTAALVAKRNGVTWTGGDSLYDPITNIILGTRYLAQMADRFNGAPWLASAAYNAGPGKVDQWLEARGTLPPDLFIATIPYKETREYVARVMSFAVIYDWRQHGNAVTLSRWLTPIGQTYMLPDSHSERKLAGCPAVAPPTPAEAASAAPASSLLPPAAASSSGTR
ncbi:transglycosylase SLT domain-containing protein [Dyella terrae]|uniref:transglycosylase SLT domain-containing protein n=1 Tax=Dyella terrae TaxID=522259 RepID=UPI001EFD0CC4|nr:transglycosylase SLT domain-containing protein [Dyella terrae]ULU26548.1 transglycosylase SLT domain-containing protein [Dyella terrae]